LTIGRTFLKVNKVKNEEKNFLTIGPTKMVKIFPVEQEYERWLKSLSE
jgi:hypothetical protein